MRQQGWNKLIMKELDDILTDYPDWESLLGDQDVLNRMVAR